MAERSYNPGRFAFVIDGEGSTDDTFEFSSADEGEDTPDKDGLDPKDAAEEEQYFTNLLEEDGSSPDPAYLTVNMEPERLRSEFDFDLDFVI